MTDDRVAATYAALTERFPEHKTPQGYQYIGLDEVTERLNTVIGPFAWSFEVRDHGIEGEQLWVLGRLTIPGHDGEPRHRDQFGSAELKRFTAPDRVDDRTPQYLLDRVGKVVDLGNDLKSATSDAFKKCAQSLGIGLYLAEERTAAADAKRGTRRPPQQQQRPQQPQPQQQPASAVNGRGEPAPVAPKPGVILCADCREPLPERVLLGDRELQRHQFATEGTRRFKRPLCSQHFRLADEAARLAPTGL